MEQFLINEAKHVVIVGGGHGIGFAITNQLINSQQCHVFATYRDESKAQQLIKLEQANKARLSVIKTDPTAETEIEGLRETVSGTTDQVDLIVNCVGTLHDEQHKPEKSLRQISSQQLSHYFSVNAIVTPLIAKAFLPLLRGKRPSILCSISAKVGSISDNRLGGWYGYRASKAALNMFIKTLSVEFSNRNIPCIAIAIHPGTTKTELSEPFTSQTKYRIYTAEETSKNILDVIDQRALKDSGKFYNWDGSELPW